MAVTVDTISYGKDNAMAGTTLTISHTVNSGSNRLIVVYQRGDNSTGGITGVTYAGDALTKWTGNGVEAGGGYSLRMWYRVAPTVGTANVVITYASTGGACSAGIASYFGVDQTTPIAAGVDYGSPPATTVNVTTVSGDMAADCTYGPHSLVAISDAGTLIAHFETLTQYDADAPVYAHHLAASGASTTLTWASDINPFDVPFAFAFAIKQAAGTAYNSMWSFS